MPINRESRPVFESALSCPIWLCTAASNALSASTREVAPGGLGELQRRGDQHQLVQIAGGDRGHLGGDHPAHRVPNQVRAVEAESGHHVPAVQGEIEHVLE